MDLITVHLHLVLFQGDEGVAIMLRWERRSVVWKGGSKFRLPDSATLHRPSSLAEPMLFTELTVPSTKVSTQKVLGD